MEELEYQQFPLPIDPREEKQYFVYARKEETSDDCSFNENDPCF